MTLSIMWASIVKNNSYNCQAFQINEQLTVDIVEAKYIQASHVFGHLSFLKFFETLHKCLYVSQYDALSLQPAIKKL